MEVLRPVAERGLRSFGLIGTSAVRGPLRSFASCYAPLGSLPEASRSRGPRLIAAGLWLCFEDHVERRLSDAPDITEAAGRDDLAQFGLASLCAEGGTHFL
jgi:hypothetical protein